MGGQVEKQGKLRGKRVVKWGVFQYAGEVAPLLSMGQRELQGRTKYERSTIVGMLKIGWNTVETTLAKWCKDQ